MPKEVIHTSNHPGDRTFDVEVGWMKDLQVQVGIREADGRSMWWVWGENYKEEIGSEISKIVMAANRSFPDEIRDRNSDVGENVLNLLDTVCGSFDSLWSTMDRKNINDLIRVLRRARDAAFGRDE